MFTTYEDACEAIVTRTEAAMEIRAHGLDPEDFFEEAGSHRFAYRGEEVLDWLGY